MADKRPLLLFSGGLDSTWQMYLHGKNKERVDYLYIDGGQSSRKIDCEAETRNDIVHWLTKHFAANGDPNFDAFYYINCIHRKPVQVKWGRVENHSWCQPISWLIGALSVADPVRHSCVEIGYVMGDEATQLIDDLTKAWNALWAVSRHGDAPPLSFPLRYTTKMAIMEQMPGELYAMTWVCELPEGSAKGGYVPCGRCRACETRKVEEYRYELRNGRKLSEVHASEAERKAWQAAEEAARKACAETPGEETPDVHSDQPVLSNQMISTAEPTTVSYSFQLETPYNHPAALGHKLWSAWAFPELVNGQSVSSN